MDKTTALKKWQVFGPGEHNGIPEMCDWWGVADDVGILAYFAAEDDAWCWRFSMVNRDLNP